MTRLDREGHGLNSDSQLSRVRGRLRYAASRATIHGHENKYNGARGEAGYGDGWSRCNFGTLLDELDSPSRLACCESRFFVEFCRQTHECDTKSARAAI